MEIKGKVLTLFPVKEGVGKTSGTPWKYREFVDRKSTRLNSSH